MADPRVKLPTWNVVRGDVFQKTVTFLRRQDDGSTAPEDLTQYGTTWAAQLRGAPDYITDVAFTVDQADAATGVLVFSLTAAQTGALSLDTYQFDIQVTGGAASPSTPFSGSLSVTKDVTR